MKKFVIFILSYAVSIGINAANIVDVYGIDSKKQDDLIKSYGTQVADIETKFFNQQVKESKSSIKQDSFDVLFQNRLKLINKIKQHYGFSYVDFDTIIYPHNKAYTTIEVISKNDKDRLRFVNKIRKPSSQKTNYDLIEKMREFQTISWQVMLSNQIDIKDTECPVYHCLPGFTHPKLKDQFALFNARAIKEKALILRTISKDSNPGRRTAATYLMGHFNDPNEIISFLTKHIMDTDSGVRNAAMRVINQTMEKAKIHEIDVLPFLNLLDSPYDTDRNKALLILSNTAKSKKSKKLITQYGKDRLLELLRLKQPNNHDASYIVLKKISGKDFGSNNYKAWEEWFLKRS